MKIKVTTFRRVLGIRSYCLSVFIDNCEFIFTHSFDGEKKAKAEARRLNVWLNEK